MPSQSFELFERLLMGHHLTVDELNDVINKQVKEDLYLEYKHGDELQKSNASDTIQEYMSGFANSEGGVLIVGVEAPSGSPKQVTGCHAHTKGNLDEWAARCLTPIASYFSPLPKFQVLSHPNGDVLIGVAPRSLRLVPRTEAGRIVYYFRIHDQTLKAPDYLMADLLLGRRQQPILDIVSYRAAGLGRHLDSSTNSMSLEFELQLQLENSSIVWADGSRIGIIAFAQKIKIDGFEVGRPSNHLLSFVDVREPQISRYSLPQPSIYHLSNGIHTDRPFDADRKRISFEIPLRIHETWPSYIWKAALYLMTKNGLPIWYQIDFVINADTPRLIDEVGQFTSSNGLTIVRLITERPVVSWEGF